jgi:hypothetical protein
VHRIARAWRDRTPSFGHRRFIAGRFMFEP